jgi:hypothetical protein
MSPCYHFHGPCAQQCCCQHHLNLVLSSLEEPLPDIVQGSVARLDYQILFQNYAFWVSVWCQQYPPDQDRPGVHPAMMMSFHLYFSPQ